MSLFSLTGTTDDNAEMVNSEAQAHRPLFDPSGVGNKGAVFFVGYPVSHALPQLEGFLISIKENA